MSEGNNHPEEDYYLRMFFCRSKEFTFSILDGARNVTVDSRCDVCAGKCMCTVYSTSEKGG